MNLKKSLQIAVAMALAGTGFTPVIAQDYNFNDAWLFHLGEAKGADAATYNDATWRKLSLPHDWAIEGKFSKENDLRTGGLPVHGTGWYRKHFVVNPDMKGKQVAMAFDGAMNNAHVWVNGQFVGNRPYGYIGFEFDITPFVKFGEENTIAVRLNPEELSARWYPGAGIYRNVFIKYNAPVHIPQWGTKITTPSVSDYEATITIQTKITNATNANGVVQLKTTIKNPQGKTVNVAVTDVNVANGSTETTAQTVKVTTPQRWDVSAPRLYTALSQVIQNGKVIDEYTTDFGIRTIEFTPNNGFLLNGKRLQLNGVCMHHDLGPLGSAVNYRARERQMQIMKSMGVNALRTSHNPPDPDWMNICDRLGFVVLVEAFDEWKMGKVKNGYNKYFDEWHEKDLRDMIRCNYNHPSVIMWSIGNEILEQSKSDGWEITKELTAICHSEDATRPTTAGFNYYPAPFKNKLANEIDVVGMNYWPLNYGEIKTANPNMVIYGSETSSQTSSRGVYHLPIESNERHETNQVSSYDAIVGPPWAYPPDVEFEAQTNNPASLGEFIWTGFDYLGEPTPYAGRDNSTNGAWNQDWPSRSSYFAPVDLAGFPKDRYFLYQSQWTTKPMVHVLPHWNWQGKEGDTIPVFAYTNCDSVELFVNGVSKGFKVKGRDLTGIPAEFHFFDFGTYKTKYRLSWYVTYAAGSLKTVAYKNGKIAATDMVKTAGEPAQIRLIADRTKLNTSGNDLSFIRVQIEDKEGNICPLANNLVQFSVEGAGVLTAVENGDATAITSYQAKERVAFNGLCLAVVKAGTSKGSIKFTATAAGLKSASLKLNAKN